MQATTTPTLPKLSAGELSELVFTPTDHIAALQNKIRKFHAVIEAEYDADHDSVQLTVDDARTAQEALEMLHSTWDQIEAAGLEWADREWMYAQLEFARTEVNDCRFTLRNWGLL